MDIVLDFMDNAAFDKMYTHFPTTLQPFVDTRTHAVRQLASLYIIALGGSLLLYFFFSAVAYYFLFDHDLMKHPKFLKNQIRREIALSVQSLPLTAVVTVPWFFFEVRGYSKLYRNVDDYGWGYLDGYFQSLPYHIFVYLFPMHQWAYLGLFVFVQCWTISIHDGAYFTNHPWVNGSAHHTIHHLEFNYNYGQYTTLWDRIGGSYRHPVEQFENEMFFERSAKKVEKAKRVAAGKGGKPTGKVAKAE
ncbi:c-5 sterol desaturase [Rhizophlyctis rosea]|nr:c-5 sterol desaturase [Rhizophlyctis rosea]